MKALVVDDSFIMRNILKNILAELHVESGEILEARDGEEALNILNKNEIDILLLDWNMPKLNGIELVKIVRKFERYKELPIIMGKPLGLQ